MLPASGGSAESAARPVHEPSVRGKAGEHVSLSAPLTGRPSLRPAGRNLRPGRCHRRPRPGRRSDLEPRLPTPVGDEYQAGIEQLQTVEHAQDGILAAGDPDGAALCGSRRCLVRPFGGEFVRGVRQDQVAPRCECREIPRAEALRIADAVAQLTPNLEFS